MDESKTLRDGIAFWRDRPNWPADFHNSQYRQWALENPHGDFTIEWWQPFAARLRRWGATRPIPAAQLETRFLESAPELSTTWHRSCEPVADRDITTVAWDTIGPFADLVAIIKPTKHPSSVFTSKFCHFLLPGVFPVVDDAALGASGTSYKQHYTTVKNYWASLPDSTRTALVDELTSEIERSSEAVAPAFPMVNKVTELCFIGQHHPR